MNALVITGIVVAVIVLFVIILYNSLILLRNKVKNSFAQIDVQLKRRTDLIPNLVESVKGYMKHEKGLLESITKARSAIMHAKTTGEKAAASNMLTESLKTLFAVAENYPKLQANDSFMKLQDELKNTEDKIAYSRQFYNDIVMVYNVKIETFPNNIFANMLGFGKENLFEASAEERKAVKVKF